MQEQRKFKPTVSTFLSLTILFTAQVAMEGLNDCHQSKLLYTQESILRYQDGGYHPVCLGDTFQNDGYTIHHKLGWGDISMVWLVEDREYVVVRLCVLDFYSWLKADAMGLD